MAAGQSALDLSLDEYEEKELQPAEIENIAEQEVAPVEAKDQDKHPSGIIPQVYNVVATASVKTQLDLKKLAMRVRNAEYNPSTFAGVTMRIRAPKTTALIFSSGNMVVMGSKSEKEAKLATRIFAKLIQKLFPEASYGNFKIRNMVALANVGFPIRLEGLAAKHEDWSSYEPELFSGLFYRMVNPKVLVTIFVNGKVVLAGAKSQDDIYEAFENIYPVLTEFKK